MTPSEPLSDARSDGTRDASPPVPTTAQAVLAIIIIVAGVILEAATIIRALT